MIFVYFILGYLVAAVISGIIVIITDRLTKDHDDEFFKLAVLFPPAGIFYPLINIILYILKKSDCLTKIYNKFVGE